MPYRVVGVDLSASEKKPTGLVVLESVNLSRWRCVEARLLYMNTVSLAMKIAEYAPHLVVVDAPLSRPPPGAGFRPAELQVLRLGGRLLPLTLRSMSLLLERALALKKCVESYAEVVETHPSSLLKISGCSIEELLLIASLSSHGNCPVEPARLSRDIRDALLASIVGVGLSKGFSIVVGDSYCTRFVLLKPGLCRVSKELQK